ncbi:methyl-accepting chemotaxis protein [Desulfobacterales bacterium HSG17]|nr:methyl-accepting chemotaxis protein [Desulfobacterales bacterium HSG17]
MSIKSKVFGSLFGTSLFIMLGMSVLAFFFIQDLVRSHLYGKITFQTERFSQLMDRTVSERCRELILFSRQDFFYADWVDDEEKQENLKKFIAESGFYKSGVYANSSKKTKDRKTKESLVGRVTVSTTPSFLGRNVKDLDWYAACIDKKEIFISDARKDEDTNSPVVTIAMPVFDMEGEMWGVVALNLDLVDTLGSMIKEEREKLESSDIRGTPLILGLNGRIIGAENPARFLMSFGDGMPGEKARQILTGKKGVVRARFTDRERTKHIVGYYAHDGYGYFHNKWKTVLVTDASSITAAIFAIGNRILWLNLIAGFFILVIAFLLTRGIVLPIRHVIKGLDQSAVHVESAAGEASAIARQVVRGSAGQASAIKETTISLEKMSSMTGRNADNALQANNLMEETNGVVDRANRTIGKLTGTMNEMSAASGETRAIVKSIDEIAFQTNLLALNAAIEAARAGETGAGFAVVASEVKNLAKRSAKAAKSTSELIDVVIGKAKDGSALVALSNEAFTKVSDCSNRAGELVSDIAAASSEQAQGIEQINQTIADIAQGIQTNADAIEKSSSASVRMNDQAAQLRIFVKQLIDLVGRRNENAKRDLTEVQDSEKKLISGK